jgi:hypothetical protein
MICTKCKADKAEGEFHFRNKALGTRHSHCKTCKGGDDGRTYRTSPTRARNIRAQRRTDLQRNREYVLGYLLAHPCVDCGESDPVCLDFDHVRGKKKREISGLVRAACSLKTLQREIAKCDVRCANCHRKVTAKRRLVGSPGVEPDSLGFQASAIAVLAHSPYSIVGGNLVGREGFEPPTPASSGLRSTGLSYRPTSRRLRTARLEDRGVHSKQVESDVNTDHSLLLKIPASGGPPSWRSRCYRPRFLAT